MGKTWEKRGKIQGTDFCLPSTSFPQKHSWGRAEKRRDCHCRKSSGQIPVKRLQKRRDTPNGRTPLLSFWRTFAIFPVFFQFPHRHLAGHAGAPPILDANEIRIREEGDAF